MGHAHHIVEQTCVHGHFRRTPAAPPGCRVEDLPSGTPPSRIHARRSPALRAALLGAGGPLEEEPVTKAERPSISGRAQLLTFPCSTRAPTAAPAVAGGPRQAFMGSPGLSAAIFEDARSAVRCIGATWAAWTVMTRFTSAARSQSPAPGSAALCGRRHHLPRPRTYHDRSPFSRRSAWGPRSWATVEEGHHEDHLARRFLSGPGHATQVSAWPKFCRSPPGTWWIRSPPSFP